MGVICEIRRQKEAGCPKGAQHQGAVKHLVSEPDEGVAKNKQQRAGSIQKRIHMGQVRVKSHDPPIIGPAGRLLKTDYRVGKSETWQGFRHLLICNLKE